MGAIAALPVSLNDATNQTGLDTPLAAASDIASPTPPAGLSVDAASDLLQHTQADNPYLRFLTRIGDDPYAINDEAYMRAVQDLFHELQLGTPPTSQADAISESSTTAFTYPIGDVDGDGTDDLALDILCTNWDECVPPLGIGNARFGFCSLPHWMEARSGRDGTLLWTHRLDRPYSLLPEDLPADPPVDPTSMIGCAREFVMGTTPLSDGSTGILVYRYERMWVLFHHDIYMLKAGGDGQGNGKVLWHYEKDGYWLGYKAENIFVWPILQVPPNRGVRLLPETLKPDLFVRGVSFISYGIRTFLTGPIIVDYKPQEWAARLGLDDGKEKWVIDTFTPDLERAVVPFHYMANQFTSNGCCWDLNADQDSDLIFTTIEWAPIQITYVMGPHGWASHTVAFNAKDGAQLYAKETEPGTDWDRFGTWLEPLGDANGDGNADYLQESIYVNLTEDGHIENLLLVATFRQGQNAEEMWKISGKKFLNLLVVGDADHDGGNDLLLGYYDLGREIDDGLTNVTDVRLAVHTGSNGNIIWETTTFSAPLDLLFMFQNSLVNGLADLDNDQVGDVWTDQPDQKDDLTLVHRTTFLSGEDGSSLFTIPSVGAYAFPIGARDTDGDAGNDITIVQGDNVDIWITASNGNQASPLWSRRLMEIPISGTILSIPRLRFHSMQLDDNGTSDLMLSFTLYVFTAGGGKGTSGYYQNHQAVQGPIGHLLWAYPETPDEEEPDISLHIGEPTPATILYTGWMRPVTTTTSGVSLPVPLLMGASSVASLGIAFFAVRRRLHR